MTVNLANWLRRITGRPTTPSSWGPKQVAFSTFAHSQHDPVDVVAFAFAPLRGPDRANSTGSREDLGRRILEGSPGDEVVAGPMHGPDLPTHPVDADAAIRAVLALHCDDGNGNCEHCTESLWTNTWHAEDVDPIRWDECPTRWAALGLWSLESSDQSL
jgi:hypothetical protein